MRIGVVSALLALACGAAAQPLEVEKYKLPNGMTVILNPDATIPWVTVNLWFRVGSKDEPPRRSGFAHLFEHLMFMGTSRVPEGEFDRLMERYGGTNNASTSPDRTNYYASGPKHLLPLLLWLEADRLEALGANMTQTKLDLQRDVVKNERREGVDNAPYGRAYDTLGKLLYPAGHPYETSVIGTLEDISAATVDDVKGFFAQFYVPNNASLVVSGDFRPEEAKAWIARWFGSLPRGADVLRRSSPAIDFRGVKRFTMPDAVPQPRVMMVWHSPPAGKPGETDLKVAASVLGDGPSSRLYRRLVIQDGLASRVAVQFLEGILGSLVLVEVDVAGDGSLDQVEAATDEVLRDFVRTGPSDEERSRAVARFEAALARQLESPSSRADLLNEFEFKYGEPNSVERYRNELRAVTNAGVQEWAAKTIDPWNRLILRVVPEAESPVQGNPRDARPEIGPPTPFEPPLPTEITLANGVRLLYWHRPGVPLMALSAAFETGSERDAVEQAGLSAIAAQMLLEGAGDRNAAAFAGALDLLGARLDIAVEPAWVVADLDVPEPGFAAAVRLLADALRRPRLTAEDFDRLKRQTRAELDQSLADPFSLASRSARQQFFGPAHPYGRLMTRESLDRLTLDGVRRALPALLAPARMTVFAAGGMPASQVKANLDDAFGDWRAPALPQNTVPYSDPDNDKLRVFLVDRPGAVSTEIAWLMPAPDYAHPDRANLAAAGTVLGGSFTSRLNQNLREAKGYTYGASGRFRLEARAGWLAVATAVQTPVTGAALGEIVKEFARLQAGTVTAEELQKASNLLVAERIEDLGTLRGTVNYATFLHRRNQTFRQARQELAEFAGLTAEGVNGAAGRNVSSGRGVLVLVGDAKAIEAQWSALGLPAPVRLTPE